MCMMSMDPRSGQGSPMSRVFLLDKRARRKTDEERNTGKSQRKRERDEDAYRHYVRKEGQVAEVRAREPLEDKDEDEEDMRQTGERRVKKIFPLLHAAGECSGWC